MMIDVQKRTYKYMMIDVVWNADLFHAPMVLRSLYLSDTHSMDCPYRWPEDG